MNAQSQLLLSEIDERCSVASSERVARMVRTLLDQYASQAPYCSPDQLDLYDQALLALVKRLDVAGMSDISHRLAQADATPETTLQFLAVHPKIDVSGPILQHGQLPDDLIETIANGGTGPQLMAIASRRVVPSEVSLRLIGSEIPSVIGQTVQNHGAVLSEMAFSLLIGLAAKDRELARLLSLRTDIPEELRSFIDMLLQ